MERVFIGPATLLPGRQGLRDWDKQDLRGRQGMRAWDQLELLALRAQLGRRGRQVQVKTLLHNTTTGSV